MLLTTLSTYNLVNCFKIGCLSKAHLYKFRYIIAYILSPRILVKSFLESANKITSLCAFAVAPLTEFVYNAYSPNESPCCIILSTFPPLAISISPFFITKKESA